MSYDFENMFDKKIVLGNIFPEDVSDEEGDRLADIFRDLSEFVESRYFGHIMRLSKRRCEERYRRLSEMIGKMDVGKTDPEPF